MNEDIKKKRKRLEQKAVELQDKIKDFDAMYEEHKKILELSKRERDNTVNIADIKLNKTYKQIVIEAGEYLENNLELVENNSTNNIVKELRKKYKGLVDERIIWFNSPTHWKNTSFSEMGKKGAEMSHSYKNIRSEILSENLNTSTETEPLTEYEQKYVELHDEKSERFEHIEALITDLLGMDADEKTRAFKQSKIQNKDHRKVLRENAHANLLRIAKGLNDADIPVLLSRGRFLTELLGDLSEIVRQELESRQKKKEMIGQ